MKVMKALTAFAKKHQDILFSFVLFWAAFAPRFPALNLFSTVDEGTWLDRSFSFLQAIARGDWAATIGPEVYPAVPTYWTGAWGILAYFWPNLSWQAGQILVSGKPIAQVYRPSLELLAFARFPTVVITSLTVALLYLLLTKSLNRRVAVLAALLLAFDPFFVALSRVFITDTLQSSFALLAVGLLVLALQQDEWRWYAASGLAAGLAFLSKSPSVVLFGLVPLLCVIVYISQRRARSEWTKLAIHLGIWYGAAVVCIFALWPSMWVQPWQSLKGIFDNAYHIGYSGYWVTPATPFFYPLAILFRSTPFSLLGALVTLVSLVSWLISCRRKIIGVKRIWILALWGTFGIYLVLFHLGHFKNDFYLLPTLMSLSILGSMGMSDLLEIAGITWRSHGYSWYSRVTTRLLMGGMLFFQAALCVVHYPYYFTYYNPVLGGGMSAATVIPSAVGHGEGLGLVVNYLNSLDDAENLRLGMVITGYFETLEIKSLKGEALRFPPWQPVKLLKYPYTHLDYLVLYLPIMYRTKLPTPYDTLVSSTEPEFVAHINGIDYAFVYRVPSKAIAVLPSDATHASIAYENGLKFLGHKLEPLTEGEKPGLLLLPFSVYWKSTIPCPQGAITEFKLRDNAFKIWGRVQIPSLDKIYGDCGQKDVVYPVQLGMDISPGTPPGQYILEMILLDEQTKQEIRPLNEASTDLANVNVPLCLELEVDNLDMEHQLGARLADQIVLLGYNLSGGAKRGETLYLTLFWQAIGHPTDNYKVFVHVVDAQGQLVNQKDNDPVDGFYPTSLWQAGQIIRDQYAIPFLDDSGAAAAGLRIGMYLPSTGERLPVTLANGEMPADRAVPIP